MELLDSLADHVDCLSLAGPSYTNPTTDSHFQLSHDLFMVWVEKTVIARTTSISIDLYSNQTGLRKCFIISTEFIEIAPSE